MSFMYTLYIAEREEELRKMWKERILAYFKVVSRLCNVLVKPQAGQAVSKLTVQHGTFQMQNRNAIIWIATSSLSEY
jgi:hypothetical protein